MMKLLSMLISSASAEGAAVATASDLASTLSSMSLLGKGLTVTGLGLAGVFLVLCLFFVTIKIMQKAGK
ncbi:MAG: hypothetical protein IKK21_10505 [Clostridia bacterium]|nr:hypothetical protein [Clostridia bacterium]